MVEMSHARSRLFTDASAAVLGVAWRPEVSIEEIPAPQRLAPESLALAATVELDGDELGGGRLVILHDPDGNPAWDGDFRCVSYARAEVDPEMGSDPMLADVGWTWLTDALERRGAAYVAPSGTVTIVSSKSFGSMEGEPVRVEVEVRASWTPVCNDGADLAVHAEVWQELLCMVAGLPPLPDGVVPLYRTGRARR